VGTSGGVWGAERGYCLMIGGPTEVVHRLEPIFATLAPGVGEIPPTPTRAEGRGTAELGFHHCGPVGAGHFVKMIHNGIEYGLMQAYAEGFDILKTAGSAEVAPELRYDFDLAEIAELWRRGSVVSSWLLDLSAIALASDPKLDGYAGFVQDSGEGRWTIEAAIAEAVPADVLSAALYTRFRSRQSHTSPRSCCRRCARSSAATRSPAAEVAPMADASAGASRAQRPADPCTVVIFGAAGDLTRRKLVPALYNLAGGRAPDGGASRSSASRGASTTTTGFRD
jgi:6-phosphogluconate dehydrogenase (decarboxylating)